MAASCSVMFAGPTARACSRSSARKHVTSGAPASGTRRPVPASRVASRLQKPTSKGPDSLRTQVVSAPAEFVLKLSDVELWENSRRLQVQSAPIADDTSTLRCLDWDRDRFDIEFGLQNGTTYNSYIIYGSEKTALIDASHEKFRQLYISALKGELDLSKLDYIIVSHTEPDHSGLVPDIIKMAPNATVLGSKVCLKFLADLVHFDFKSQEVKNGDQIDLGGGHLLEFVIAPNLHWPDTIFTYDHGTSSIFTCDAFGMHYCTEDFFDMDLMEIETHYRFYYDCLMKPNARSVLTALRKCKNLDFRRVCPGHGPILRFNTDELVNRYRTWSEAVGKSPASCGVLYVSDYGFSDRLSQTIARGLTKAGVAVEMMDLVSADPQELVELVGRSAALVIMAPPHEGEAVLSVGTVLAASKANQRVLVAESYGGDDEPVDLLVSKFAEKGVSSAGAALRVKDTPTEGTYQMFEESGTDLGQLLLKKESIAAMKGMDSELAKALGRISGGLYVVTAAQGSSRSAMIASWVSQASFEPLGLTIAVAKDRAIESLMQVGDNFCINCLPEGRYQPLMKHFLKRFGPGQDRFEGVNMRTGSNGSPVLMDAVAHMECTVKSRMETADHWIVYGEVMEGDVADPETKTAAHHRKIGNYY
mmetsp:Transcript_29244/g.82532  ORF Transcript_29244/g.82532 Transcript_29244/m.82532 type:complete len:646 (-) Transcript_29244:189-2126(-)|eukprot:CAMPEP_0117663506 /NCGR_PEP_ID=MMETSP0804-20121206/8649_1 /TAXON_ID=1074897 /ORGANISM="Tetraselmis astigmatica, Strain CCMP880" /LENGTH=645 /DNA_ID=CAMNT_0005470529 /DNA_START=91 /DNA_END=2028 /DNA_ORIENTATION=-